MDSIPCSLCGSESADLVLAGRDRLHNLGGTFHVVRCRRCGLLYLNPRPSPDELQDYYPTDDYIPYTVAIEDEPSPFKRLDRRFGLHKRCRAVTAQFSQPGRMLDVGCATGIFVDGMRRRGWEAYGVEINPEVAQYARQRLGLNVFTGELADAAFAEGFFDLVTLWDVLEHVSDPRQTLQEIARVLRPGGLLVLSLPSLESLEARLFGPYWIGWDLPRHLHLFPRPVLTQLLEEMGFQLTKLSFFTGRYYVFVLSTQLWLEERLSSKRLRKIILGTMRSWPMRLLALPLYAVLDRLGKSSIMVAFARRVKARDYYEKESYHAGNSPA